MATKKLMSQTLKTKMEKLGKDLEKVQSQKAQLTIKEKELVKQLKTTEADYVVTLMTESGKSIEELERFARENTDALNGGGSHVQNY